MATGAVAAEYDYDSFGQRTLVQGVEEVRYGFTSREHDALTGLIHYRARAYDPLTGQFLQRDPIGFASGDLNLYAYVENDPYNLTDPSGLTTMEIAGPGGSIQRDAANRAPLSGIFGGVLNLANAIRASLVSAAAIGTGVVMNQSGDGERSIGDNSGPPLDDDTDAGPPDPLDPLGAALAAVTAVATETAPRGIEFNGQDYTVDGITISQSDYDRLWREGRPAPFLQVQSILNSNPQISRDPRGAPGYFRYEGAGLEMVYNPATGRVVHLQPVR